MWGIISFRFKRCIPFPEIVRKLKEILWNTPIFWQCILFISENTYETEHFPFYMAIIYTHNSWLSPKQKYCKAIMDDLLLITPSKRSHMDKLEDLFKVLLKNGLNFSPRKCQLLRTNSQYMGNEIFIQNKKVCMKALRSRLEPPTTVKGCRSFAGMVNFLSMFCPELQKLLKPIYDLTRKNRLFGEKNNKILLKKLNEG